MGELWSINLKKENHPEKNQFGYLSIIINESNRRKKNSCRNKAGNCC